MNKSKGSVKSATSADIQSGNQEGVSTFQTATTKESVKTIRILYLGTCPKLTTRGRGDLSYEIGIDDATSDSYVRITANVSSGAFSNEWLALSQIRTLLELKAEQQKAFSAVTMESVFHRRSANNHGYLAAVLKAEGVLNVLPGKPVMLNIGEWGPVLQKIKSLKDDGTTLTDHIAIAIKQKATKRAELMANMQASKKAKESKPKDEPNDQISATPENDTPDSLSQDN